MSKSYDSMSLLDAVWRVAVVAALIVIPIQTSKIDSGLTASTSKHLWIIETRTIVVKEGVTCHVQDGHKTPQNDSKQLKMPSKE